MKVRSGWQSGKGLRTDPDGKQVRCLTADEGHVWMHYHDRLPSIIRRRLAESPFNICPACASIEPDQVAAARGLRRPTLRVYLDVIKAIEDQLK